MNHPGLFQVIPLLIFLAAASAEATTTIRVSLQLPADHSLGKNWAEFAEIVRATSDGEIQVELYPSAELFDGSEVVDAVGRGAVEAGSAFIGAYDHVVPGVDVISIPFIFRDDAHIQNAVTPGSALRRLLDSEILETTNNRVLWWQAFGRNIYLSKTSPVTTPGDLRNTAVRTYGQVQDWTVESLDGEPRRMPGSKQYRAYEKGEAEIGMTGVSTVLSRKLHEVMNHMTLTFDSVIEFVAVINNDFYHGLSAEQRSLVDSAAKQVELKLRGDIYAQEQDIVSQLRELMDVVEINAQQRSDWEEATIEVRQRFIREAGKSGQAALSAIQQ